jgi:type II restriction enzyme
MTPLTGNKGEWSEVYVLLKLLSEGRLYKADANLNKLSESYYHIRGIIRNELHDNVFYKYDNSLSNINIHSSRKKYTTTIPLNRFVKEVKPLYSKIKSGSSAFSIETLDLFLEEIMCSILKADSSSKSDIHIEIYDPVTSSNHRLGFSIKSQLGSSSTLLNSSKSTNFTYAIMGDFSDSDMLYVNNLFNEKNHISISKRICHIETLGCHLSFSHISDPIFENNLVMIDSALPKVLAQMLLFSYRDSITNMKLAVDHISIVNPLQYNTSFEHHFYQYKIKKLLTDIALGMVASKVWNGISNTTGGYIIVKLDGDIVCYHIYDRNLFEDYLLTNTKFDQPSTQRHSYGSVEKFDGKYYFKLNLQIRFTK